MSIRSIIQLKAWFRKGKYPTEEQFSDWLDSFFHKEEDTIPMSQVDQLTEQLNNKYSATLGEELKRQHDALKDNFNEHEEYSENLFEEIVEDIDNLEEADEQLRKDLEAETERATGQEAAIREEFAAADAETLKSAKGYTDEKDAQVRQDFAAADAQLREDLEAETERATGQEAAIRKEFAAADAETLKQGKAYTDARETQIHKDYVAADTEALTVAKDYTDTRETNIRFDLTAGDSSMLDAAKKYADNKVAEVVNGSPEALDTLKELSDALGADPNFATTVSTQIGKKVDKVDGKGLSTNDYTTEEKKKLDGIAAGANNYTHPTNHPATMITEDTTHRFITDDERKAWNAKPGSSTATGSSAGLMSADDKKKLDGIAAGANNYTHPESHPATMITEDTTHRFITDDERKAWNAKPGSSTATGSSAGLMSADDKKKLDGINLWKGTQAAYNALGTKDANTLYIIIE